MRSTPPLERPEVAALMPAMRIGLASSFFPSATKARPKARCEATCTGSSWTATRRFSTASSKLPPSCSSLFPRPYRPKNPLGFLATICRNASRSIPPFISYQVSEKGGISENGSRHVSYHTRSQGMPGLRADFAGGEGDPQRLCQKGKRKLTESAKEFPKASVWQSPEGSLREARKRRAHGHVLTPEA